MHPFLLFLLPMPYGYYLLIRFVSMIAFGVMAYQYIQQKKKGWVSALRGADVDFWNNKMEGFGKVCIKKRGKMGIL